jgi:hypothetical protein
MGSYLYFKSSLNIFINSILITAVIIFSQCDIYPQKRQSAQKAKIHIDAGDNKSTASVIPNSPPPENAENYVVVDIMANAFGPASTPLNPLAYDPYSDIVAIVHRGHSSYGASGQLWYNYSTNRGLSWSPRIGPVRDGAARYPSMAISNAVGGVIDWTTAAFAWPELTPSTFGYLGYGADQPVGAGASFNAIIMGPSAYSSHVPVWTTDGSRWIFWAADNQDNADIEVWRTQDDYYTVSSSIIPGSVFSDVGNILLGGAGIGSTQYLAAIGTFPDPDSLNPIKFGWYPGILKSIDNGQTWDNGTVIDFRTIPLLSNFDQLTDYDPSPGFIRFDGDINIDQNGKVHVVLGVTDTNTFPETHALVDIFQTPNGWDATIIAYLQGDPQIIYQNGPGLGQMGYSVYLAFDKERQVMAAQWVDKGVGGWADIYMSYKLLESATWSVPRNLTESIQNNTQSHLAPRLAGSNGSYTAFSMYGYEQGNSGPFSDTTLTTEIYVAPVHFIITNTPFIIVTFPNGGESLGIGSTYTITWQGWNVGNVKLEYSTNSGSSWIVITSSTVNSGSYQWNVPATPSSNCRVRVSSVSDPDLNDMSNNDFIISYPSVTVTAPNGGELLIFPSTYNITWTGTGLSNVKIEFSTNAGTNWTVLTNSYTNSGTYPWAIPYVSSTNCLVRISSSTNPSIYDVSDAVFSIVRKQINVTSPNGGEILYAGYSHDITWTSNYVSSVAISYSSNNGTNWINIISSTPSDGSYIWTIPNIQSTNCRIRISDVDNQVLYDISNGIFTIKQPVFFARIQADPVWLDNDFNGVQSGQVNGSGSTINPGSIVNYKWYINGEYITSGVSPVINLYTGTNLVKLVVESSTGTTAKDSLYISVYSVKKNLGSSKLTGISQHSGSYYVTSMNNSIYMIDSAGTLNQSFGTGGSIQSSASINMNTSRIYSGSSDSRLYCFDRNLNSIWDKGIGGVVDNTVSFNYTGEIIYAGTSDNNSNISYLRSLNTTDGSARWSFQAAGKIVSAPVILEIVDSNYNVLKKIIYFGTSKGTIYAVEDMTVSGVEIWSKHTSPDSAIVGSPAISDEGMVYFGSRNNYVYRFRWDGYHENNWQKNTLGKILNSPVIDENGVVYFCSEAGYVYGLEKNFTTDTPFSKRFKGLSNPSGTPALGQDGTLLVPYVNKFFVLDKNSSGLDMPVNWYLNTTSAVSAPVLVSDNGIVLIGSGNGELYVMKNPGPGVLDNYQWPTFKGDNQRAKVVRLVTTLSSVDNTPEVITSYRLYQNYPNPFNPSTKIKYQVPVTGHVSVKIYDIIGNEISDLVNDEQKPGVYEIDMDSGTLPSGIYFCQFRSGSFMETVKMVLLK